MCSKSAALAEILRLIDAEEALRIVLDRTPSPMEREVAVDEAGGWTLAEGVLADRDYPPFDRAMMDGFAVRLADAGRRAKVVGEVCAGQVSRIMLRDGEAASIMTGAACPSGTQAVVPIEQVISHGDAVEAPSGIREGMHISPQGSECAAGRRVLKAGDRVTPLAVANLATFGYRAIRVYEPPPVGLALTGNELVRSGESLGSGQIRDSNGPMLAALVRDAGMAMPCMAYAGDTLESLEEALSKMAFCRIILFSGGVSAGKYDLVGQVLESWGAQIVFHRVKQKPGKPLLFACKADQLCFGLPGNPLSAHFCFHRYVAPVLRKLSGKGSDSDCSAGTLTAPVTNRGDRMRFIPGRAKRSRNASGEWEVEPLEGQGSADVFAVGGANCYIPLPAGDQALAVGDQVDTEWIGRLRW